MEEEVVLSLGVIDSDDTSGDEGVAAAGAGGAGGGGASGREVTVRVSVKPDVELCRQPNRATCEKERKFSELLISATRHRPLPEL
eukprot:g18285.t1